MEVSAAPEAPAPVPMQLPAEALGDTGLAQPPIPVPDGSGSGDLASASVCAAVPDAAPGAASTVSDALAPPMPPAEGAGNDGTGGAALDDGAAGAPPVEDAPLPPPPARKHRWGPPMNLPKGDPPKDAGGDAKAERKRKRKSRWEEDTTAMAIVPASGNTSQALVVASFPKAVTLSNGMEIRLPANVTGEVGLLDPKVRVMRDELEEINRKLAVDELDIPPEGQRSPSPEPVYDRMGTRVNTREIRAREKLVEQRHKLIEDLIKEDPSFRPPSDYKPRKFTNKIFIPIKEYPSYNFIGLIIGPRGNTQKTMQKETNTRIAIRGRGSVKDGINRNPSYDYGEDEELHVLITGDTKEDVEKATQMINMLLRPVDEEHNIHKKRQLRELAAINGTLKDETSCYICGESSHRSEHCPKKTMEVYQLPTDIQDKVNEQYERDVARMGGSTAGMESEYKNFLKELGGAPPEELMGGGSAGGRPAPGEDLKLFVGSLPLTFTDAQLRAIFEPFGSVTHASVMQDGAGTSRGFGFVHFDTAEAASAAKEGMHGKMVDGRPLHVRLKSEPAVPRDRPGLGFGGPPPLDEKKLYAGFLPNTMTEPELKALFEAHGQVDDVRIVTDKATGLSKGFGFVSMGSIEAAKTARAALDGYFMGTRPIKVMVAGEKSSSDRSAGGPPRSHAPPSRPPPGPLPPPGPAPPGAPYGGYGGGGYGMAPYGAPPPPTGAAPWGAPPAGPYGGPPPPPGAPYGAPPPPGAYGAPPPAPPGPGGYGGYGGGYGDAAAAYAGSAYGGYPGYGGYSAAPPPGAPPPVPGYDQVGAYGQASAPPGYEANPPLPSDAPPPPAPGAEDAGGAPPPPPPPPSDNAQSDYEKFMAEMSKSLA